MENSIKTIFASKIIDGRLYLDDKQYITVADFANEFSNVSEITYDNLITANGYIDEEQTGKGYKPFLDQCKTEGILL